MERHRSGERPRIGHIYVEPGESPRLLLGSVCVHGNSGLVVFDFSDRHQLSFAVRGDDIMLLNLKVSAASGERLLDVVDGHVRVQRTGIEFRSRPGAVEVPAGFDSPFIPDWVRTQLLGEEEFYGMKYKLPLLALKVVDRGLVRVQGLWLEPDRGVIITSQGLSFVQRRLVKPITIMGDGEETVINYVGPVDRSLFAFALQA